MTYSGLNSSRLHMLAMVKLDTPILSGAESTLNLENGSQATDFSAQFATLLFGHNNKEFVSHMTEVMCSNEVMAAQPFYTYKPHELASRLKEIAPAGYENVVLGTSGSEIVERALKLARFTTNKPGIISTKKGYHGKTLGALAVTGNAKYQQGFFVNDKDVHHIPYGDLESLEHTLKLHGDTISAFIFEPMQGEAGAINPPAGYISNAINLCREYGVLTILDEIQTGFGRTGKLFAIEHELKEDTPLCIPDIMLLSKAMGGGMMPIAGMLVREDAWTDGFDSLDSSTFAAMKMPIAAALKTIEMITRDNQQLVRDAHTKGEYLEAGFNKLQKKYPGMFTHTGLGLLRGVHLNNALDSDSAFYNFIKSGESIAGLAASYLLNKHGILTAPPLSGKCSLRISPALTITEEEIDHLLSALDSLLCVIKNKNVPALVEHILEDRRSEALLENVVEKSKSETPLPLVNIHSNNSSKGGLGAFLVPATTFNDAVIADPSLRDLNENLEAEYLDWIACQDPQVSGEVMVRSQGKDATVKLIAIPMTPMHMFMNRSYAKKQILKGVDLARDLGATHVGMGAHTSIFTNGGRDALNRGIHVTNGNTGTAISAANASLKAHYQQLADEQKKLIMLGSTGSVGSTVLNFLVRENELNELFIAARHGLQMKKQIEHYKKLNPDLSIKSIQLDKDGKALFEKEVNNDLDAAFDTASLIISSLAIEDTIDTARVINGHKAVLCDVGRPSNFTGESNEKLHSFDGGQFLWNCDVDLSPFQVTPHNQTWGCLGETMLLTLENQDIGHVGKDAADDEYITMIKDMAVLHEIQFPHNYWQSQPLS